MDVERVWEAAQRESVRRMLTEQPPVEDPVDHIMQAKVANADPELLQLARQLDPENPFRAYEKLGGL